MAINTHTEKVQPQAATAAEEFYKNSQTALQSVSLGRRSRWGAIGTSLLHFIRSWTPTTNEVYDHLFPGGGTIIGGSNLLTFKSGHSIPHSRNAKIGLARNQRENPHQVERRSLAGLVRPGCRSRRMFSRRLKSNSPGRSRGSKVRTSRCPFAGSVVDNAKRMHDTTQKISKAEIDRLQGRPAAGSWNRNNSSAGQVRK